MLLKISKQSFFWPNVIKKGMRANNSMPERLKGVQAALITEKKQHLKKESLYIN